MTQTARVRYLMIFVVVREGLYYYPQCIHMIYFPIFFRVASLATGHSQDRTSLMWSSWYIFNQYFRGLIGSLLVNIFWHVEIFNLYNVLMTSLKWIHLFETVIINPKHVFHRATVQIKRSFTINIHIEILITFVLEQYIPCPKSGVVGCC